jgi:hypothetical protein
MLGGGEANILGGETIYRVFNVSVDDAESYQTVLCNHAGLRTIFGTDSCLFAGIVAGHSNLLHQIYMSTNAGLDWTPVYIDKYKIIFPYRQNFNISA